METKVNVVLLIALLAAWGSLSLTEPASALDPLDSRTAELAALEDAFATDRGNARVAAELADHYLNLNRPQLAIQTLGVADDEVREDPTVLHRLAQAYEETGRMYDALSTANLARARCARAIGTWDASVETEVPTRSCTQGTLASLEVHVTALAHMVRWGVTDPRFDERGARAYVLAARNARILSASAE